MTMPLIWLIYLSAISTLSIFMKMIRELFTNTSHCSAKLLASPWWMCLAPHSCLGHYGYYLKGITLKFSQILYRYGLDFLELHRYTLILTPIFMKRDVLARLCQIEDFEETHCHVDSPTNASNDYMFRIATSEQTLWGFLIKESSKITHSRRNTVASQHASVKRLEHPARITGVSSVSISSKRSNNSALHHNTMKSL